MKTDPNHIDYLRNYDSIYYNKGLTAYFMRKSHQWAERRFGPDTHFAKVLEVGAGRGTHVPYVRHSFNEYIITDFNPPSEEQVKRVLNDKPRGAVTVQKEDAARLTYPDKQFDRLIAAHIWEHLFPPQEVLKEWVRVLKPGGTLSLILPCDPGVAWRLGRYVFTRRQSVKAGLDYDYLQAFEHVNPINNLVAFVRYYFDDVREEWRPFRIPSMDFNLFYIAHVRV